MGHDGCSAWTEKTCGGNKYFGGRNECGRGSTLTAPLDMAHHVGATRVTFKADIFTIDSWDAEWVYVKLKDQAGNVIAERSF
jgi:hypothetical protein